MPLKDPTLPLPTPIPGKILPAMRGVLRMEADGRQKVEGKWAMTLDTLNLPSGVKSDFEFVSEGVGDFPVSGKHTGWFGYQDPAGLRKIRDTGTLRFTQNSDGGHNVSGDFTNEFGHFSVMGTLSEESVLQIFRLQQDIGGAQRVVGGVKRPSSAGGGGSTGVKRKLIKGAKSSGSGSKALREFLNRMSKRVGGEWFKEPVDLIQNPNYLGVIVKPMDFSTVRKKLETGQYQDPDDFFSDCRLIFTNCMTYNPPQVAVHCVARDFSKYLEDNVAKVRSRALDEKKAAAGRGAPPTAPSRSVPPQNLSKAEQDVLAADTSALFDTSGSDLQKAYAWAAWQFLTQYVPESKRETSGDQIQIGINQLSHEAQKRLRALIQDWKKASKSQDADQDDRRGRLEREESVASSLADGGPNSDSESDDIGGALKEPSAAPSLMPKDSELVFDREMSLQVIDDAEALPDEQVTVSNLDAWGAADAELAEESDKLADTEAAAEDGWSTARQEKLEKEKREQERKSQEAAMAAAQRLREAERAAELAAEAERARKERDAEVERKKEEERKKAEEERASIEAKRERDRKARENMEQEVDLDEVRGDEELMAMMNQSL